MQLRQVVQAIRRLRSAHPHARRVLGRFQLSVPPGNAPPRVEPVLLTLSGLGFLYAGRRWETPQMGVGTEALLA